MNHEKKAGATAVVEWLRGKRALSLLMRKAGLGISGLGIKERVVLTYAEGETVDHERVMRTVRKMISESDRENTDWVIYNPRVISITPAWTTEVNAKAQAVSLD